VNVFQDLKLAFRTHLRAPATTAAALAALVIGLGATTAVYTLTRAVLLAGLPYEEPEQLLWIGGRWTEESGEVQDWPVGVQDIEALRAQDVVIGPAAVTGSRSFNLRMGDVARHVQGELVSADYFDILRVGVARGRSFTAEESSIDAPAAVAVISHAFWQDAFGAREDVVGSRLELNELTYEVIGVADAGFHGLTDDASVWLPIGMAGRIYQPGYTTARGFRWLSGVARLADGATPEQAQAALDRITRELGETYPQENAKFGVSVQTLGDAYFGNWRQPLLIVLAAAGFLLLIACSNVANLLVVRTLDRRGEIALRAALGAGRGRIARQFLLESAVLALIGLAGGLALARLILSVIERSGGLELATFHDLGTDTGVVAMGAALAVFAVLVCGTVPALFSARVDPQGVLREASGALAGTRSRRFFHNGMLALQIALALMLVVGASVMTRGLAAYAGTELGFRSEGISTGRIDLTGEQFRDNERFWSVVRAVASEIAALPDVEAVAAEGPGLPTNASYAISFLVDGSDAPVMGLRHHVTPGYFDALAIPLRAGRDFTDADRGGTRDLPLIVSESFARQYLGDDALGRALRFPGNDTLRATVVGVAADAQHHGHNPGANPAPAVYLPLYMAPPRIPPLVTFFARTRSGRDLGAALDDAVKRAAPGIPLFDPQPLDARLNAQTATPRLMTRMVAAFSAVALILAAIGVYGVVAYSVRMRTREMGIRMALGASRGSVLRSASDRVLAPLAVGLVAGIAGAVLLGRFAGSLLFGLTTADPAALLLTALATCVVTAVATLLPAWRALRSDPRQILR